MPKTITVFNATGHQGGAVARALARDGDNFNVRGVTRNVQQELKVDELKDDGVTVLQCDLDSVDNIRMAVNDTDGVFIVTYTDFTEPDCINREKRRGRNIIDACVQAGVPHVIYSTQLHTTRVKGIEVRHLVAKAEIEEYLSTTSLSYTSFLVPCYYENLFDSMRPRRVDGNNYVLEIPMGDSSLDLVSVEDIGDVARTVFLNPDPYVGKTLSLCGSKITISEMAAALSRYLAPLSFKDKPITVNDYKRLKEVYSVDYGNMFEFFVRKDQRYHLEHTEQINPNVQTFQVWLSRNAQRLSDAFNKL